MERERYRLLNLDPETLAHYLIVARVADAEQRRRRSRLVRARRLTRQAEQAAARAERLSHQAALAQRQTRVAGARVT
jgi:hypothetical protein